jgi:hypothetical protein
LAAMALITTADATGAASRSLQLPAPLAQGSSSASGGATASSTSSPSGAARSPVSQVNSSVAVSSYPQSASVRAGPRPSMLAGSAAALPHAHALCGVPLVEAREVTRREARVAPIRHARGNETRRGFDSRRRVPRQDETSVRVRHARLRSEVARGLQQAAGMSSTRLVPRAGAARTHLEPEGTTLKRTSPASAAARTIAALESRFGRSRASPAHTDVTFGAHARHGRALYT